jgi:hypothetical protein
MKSFKKAAILAVVLGSSLCAFAAPVERAGGYKPNSAIAQKDPYHLTITADGGVPQETYYATSAAALYKLILTLIGL